MASELRPINPVETFAAQEIVRSVGDCHAADEESVRSGKVSISAKVNQVDEKDTGEPIIAAEAITAVWGKWTKRFMWLGLGLMYTIFELDNTTLYLFLPYATSSFEHHSLLAAVSVVGTIVSAVAKPPIAKLSDVIGRAETYTLCISFYCLAYIILSTATTVQTYAGGYVFYALGQTGTQVLDSIIIAVWCSASIVQAFLHSSTWRWGIGMFGFLMPSVASVLIVSLFLAQRRARKSGLIQPRPAIQWRRAHWMVYNFCSAIDLGGIILLSGGAALILVPCSLAATTPAKWGSSSIDAALGVGAVFLLGFPAYERYLAQRPLIPFHFLQNRTIVVSCLLSFFDSCGWSLSSTYLYSWINVTQGWSAKDTGYYIYTNGLVQCLSAMIAGLLMWKTRKYTGLIYFAVVIRMVGYGLMLRFRKAPEKVVLLVITQVIAGFGSGIIVQVTQVASQIVVAHKHLASVTSFVLLCSFLGSAVGESVAGAIWTNGMPGLLAKHLPGYSATQISDIFNSITDLPAFGSAERDAISQAYIVMMRRLITASLGVAAPLVVIMCFLPNLTLSDSHNHLEEQHKLDDLALANGASEKEV